MATGNLDRIKTELEKAGVKIPERLHGYRQALVECAIDCITTTAEHDDRKTNINQRFDACLTAIAKQLASPGGEDAA